MSFTLLAAVVPAPQGPTSGISIGGSTNSTTTAPTVLPVPDGTFFCERVNRAFAALAMTAAFGGGLYGVCDGLTITGAGLNATVAIGRAMIFGPVELTAPIVHTVPDSTARVYLWVKQNATVTHTVTRTPPDATSVFIGSFPTAGGNIGAIEYSGVLYMGAIPYRFTADLKAPADTPGAATQFLTITPSNTWIWDGQQYSQLLAANRQALDPTNVQSLSANLTLDITSPNVQILKAVTVDRKVFLPVAEQFANWFEIWNVGAANNILLRDSGDTITVATITPGHYVARFRPTPDASGNPFWPAAGGLTVLAAPTAGPS